MLGIKRSSVDSICVWLLRKIIVGMITWLTVHFTCDLISAMVHVICNERKEYAHAWHQMSLLKPDGINNTNSNSSWILSLAWIYYMNDEKQNTLSEHLSYPFSRILHFMIHCLACRTVNTNVVSPSQQLQVSLSKFDIEDIFEYFHSIIYSWNVQQNTWILLSFPLVSC